MVLFELFVFCRWWKTQSIHVHLALSIWFPSLLSSHTPLPHWNLFPLLIFFNPFSLLSCPHSFPPVCSFLSFFPTHPPFCYFFPFLFTNFFFECVCIFVCMCSRIWPLHVYQPMITSSMLNWILNMCSTRKQIKSNKCRICKYSCIWVHRTDFR